MKHDAVEEDGGASRPTVNEKVIVGLNEKEQLVG